MLKKLITTSLLLIIPFVTFADAQTSKSVKAPVNVILDEKILEKLSEPQRELLHAIAKQMGKDLTYWAQYPIELPTSMFPEDSQIVEVGNLFKEMTSDEVERIAYDENGNLKRLNAEQIAQISQDALFIVPSVEYPGQNHVWKITIWLQKGAKNIKLTFNKGVEKALDHLIIEVPARFVGNNVLSVKKAIHSLYHGLRDGLSVFIGLVETEPKYGNDEIVELLEKRTRETTIKKLQRDETLDLRLYTDAELAQKAYSVLNNISNDHYSWWKNNEEKFAKEIRDTLSAIGVPENELEERTFQELDKKRIETFYERILTDKRLETVATGLGQLLVNRDKATRISIKTEQDLENRVAEMRETNRKLIKKQHPVLSMSSKWLEKNVEAKTLKQYHEVRWIYYDGIIINLKEQGLIQEAKIFESNTRYLKENEKKIVQEIESEKVAERKFNFGRRIWNSKNWAVGVSEEKDDNGNVINKEYYALKYKLHVLKTSTPVWRIMLMGMRSGVYLNNGLYKLLVSNLWNGPMGLKSLFKKDPFLAKMTVDEKTGAIIPDFDSETSTLSSRISDIWSNIRESRASFEEKPDTGLIGKSVSRQVNRVWNYGIKGALGTTGVSIAQPIGTLANTVITAGLTATSVVWAPMASMFQWGFNATILDTDTPGRINGTSGLRRPVILPALSNLLYRAGLKGLGRATVATIAGSVYHPTMSLGYGATAFVRRGARTAYDYVVRKVLSGSILKFIYARVPARDGYLAVRTQGPGLTSTYIFQIKPEIAILALQAYMENNELRAYAINARSEIEKPYNEFTKYLNDLFRTFGNIDLNYDGTVKFLGDLQSSQINELDRKTEERYATSSRLLKYPVERNMLGQTTEDLETTIRVGSLLVKAHYEEKVFPGMSEKEIKEFWTSLDAAPGDFVTLTRSLIGRTFSQSFLTPIQENDKTFRIVIEEESLRGVLENIKRGIPLQDMDKIDPQVERRTVKRSTPARREYSPIPAAGSGYAGDICSILFREMMF